MPQKPKLTDATASKQKDDFIKGTVDTSKQQTSYTAIQVHKKKATFNLDIDLHRRLKVTAAQNDREMVELVEDALTQYLDQLDQHVGEH